MDFGFGFFTTFIFVFGVVYGLLVVSDIFGKQKRVSAIIALAFGLFAASYEPVVDFIQNFLPYATAILVVLFFLIFVKILLFGKKKKKEDRQTGVHVILVMLIVVILFFAAAASSGWLQRYMPYIRGMPNIDITNILWALGLLLVAIILYIAYDRTVERGVKTEKTKKTQL